MGKKSIAELERMLAREKQKNIEINKRVSLIRQIKDERFKGSKTGRFLSVASRVVTKGRNIAKQYAEAEAKRNKASKKTKQKPLTQAMSLMD